MPLSVVSPVRHTGILKHLGVMVEYCDVERRCLATPRVPYRPVNCFKDYKYQINLSEPTKNAFSTTIDRYTEPERRTLHVSLLLFDTSPPLPVPSASSFAMSQM